MNQDPAFTPERIDDLNAVDLRLFGVTRGITENVGGVPHVRGGDDSDFDGLLAVANELNPERGDTLAIEPTGFNSAWAEDMTLTNILPALIPEIPIADMSEELREEIVAFLERGRRELRLNNLVYAAAHTVLRGVPVHRAEVSKEDWAALQNLLPELGTSDAQNEIGLFYRNTKMLTRLGDIAIAMRSSDVNNADGDKPILLFASGKGHTPRLAERLSANGISFMTNL